jgi:steroid 5-alpha reductase family enzyme
MTKEERTAIAVIPVAIAIGLGLAAAGAQGGQLIGGLPFMYLVITYAFGVQWLAFIPAILYKTEKFYDLTGGFTYMSIATGMYFLLPGIDLRSLVILLCIFIWSARLGLFLFRRIARAGSDSRFDAVRGSFWRFLMAWTLQGLWVSFSVAAGLAAVTSERRVGADVFLLSGLLLWLFGFGVEAIADTQKNSFRKNPENHGRFISTGLWAWSRHPNYFGEIVLWFGVALMAFPALAGWQYVTLSSPFLVTLLLTRISGIPLLEEAAERKWGAQKDYKSYRQSTPVLIPRVPKKS